MRSLFMLARCRAHVRRCSVLALLLLLAFGRGASASALYTGTVASDVQSASFGYSQLTRAVGAAPDGTIYVGFFSADKTQVRVAKSTDRGATFSPSVVVDTAGVGLSFTIASLTVSDSGGIFVAYIDSGSNVFIAHSTDGGVMFNVAPSLGTTTSPNAGVQVQAQGIYVYGGYLVPGGVAVATSSDGGLTFPPPVTAAITGGFFGLLVDQSNGDLVVGGESASLYVTVSHDHGATFDPVQNPSGAAFFSNWTISSDVTGRYVWVGGTAISSSVYQIDLSNYASTLRTAFLTTATPQARSMYGVGCGDIVDSVDGSVAVVHDFGTTLGTTHGVAGANQTTFANPLTGDMLVAYQNGTATQLDVYQGEIVGCGARLNLMVSDGHDFARYGSTMNYLVTLSSAGGSSADDIAVSLSTPGSGLDLVNAQWQCVGSDNTAICPASSGNGPSLGTVTLPAGTKMTWLVSVPVLASTTDDAIELDANAVGAENATGSDTDALVIFRSGFDVANGDGTRMPQ